MNRVFPIVAIITATGLLAGMVWPMVVTDHHRASQDVVMESSRHHDPRSIELKEGFNSYVQRALLPDGIECGTITLEDRAQVHYWFASHHLTRDQGATLFRFPDGSERMMAGCFCCELQLPDAGFRDAKGLHAFIDRHDGQAP